MELLALDSRTVAGSLAPGMKSPADSPEGMVGREREFRVVHADHDLGVERAAGGR